MSPANPQGNRRPSRRRTPLVGPCRPRIEQRVVSTGPLAHLARGSRVHLFDGKLRRPGRDPKWTEKTQVDLNDVTRFALRVHTAAARVVYIRVEEPSERLAQVLA